VLVRLYCNQRLLFPNDASTKWEDTEIFSRDLLYDGSGVIGGEDGWKGRGRGFWLEKGVSTYVPCLPSFSSNQKARSTLNHLTSTPFVLLSPLTGSSSSPTSQPPLPLAISPLTAASAGPSPPPSSPSPPPNPSLPSPRASSSLPSRTRRRFTSTPIHLGLKKAVSSSPIPMSRSARSLGRTHCRSTPV
jgi:hypothetical protein